MATNKINHPPKIKAYLDQLKSGKQTSDKAKIIEILAKGPATLETFILRGFKIQTISARLSELEDDGIVKKYGCKKGFSWFNLIEDENEQKAAKTEKLLSKKNAWFKRGLQLGFISNEQLLTLTTNTQ